MKSFISISSLLFIITLNIFSQPSIAIPNCNLKSATVLREVTVHNALAGNLALAIIESGQGPLTTITSLTVTGQINSLDISQMKSNMSILEEIDLQGASLENNTLPASAFKNKTSLKKIVLPSSLTSIENYSFSGCTSLVDDFTFPPSITNIGNYAFSYCGLTTDNLVLPESLITIGDYAFEHCNNITGVLVVPDNVISIGEKCFYYCSGITELQLGISITSIDDRAFLGCDNLSGELLLPTSLQTIGLQVFADCNFSGSLILPNSLTTLKSWAFYRCTGFTELHIGKNLEYIADYAFSKCTGITKISVHQSKPPQIFASTFEDINTGICQLHVPVGYGLSYQTAEHWGLFLNVIGSLDLTTDLIQPDENEIKVYNNYGTIYIEGLLLNDKILVYTIEGVLVNQSVANHSTIFIPLNHNGIYLVKINGKTYKINL